MRSISYFVAQLLVILCLATSHRIVPALPLASPGQDPPLEIGELIQTVAEKETELHAVWLQYTYKQVTAIDFYGSFGHESATLTSEIVFRDSGRREIQVVEQEGELSHVFWGFGVDDVLGNLQPFVLTTKELPNYSVDYKGSDDVGGMQCHLFFLTPKSIEAGKLYFKGEIWVEKQSLHVVRIMGKPFPQEASSQFPEFDTRRDLVEGRFWFPFQTRIDENLQFPSGFLKVKGTTDYQDYRRFGSEVKIDFKPPRIDE